MSQKGRIGRITCTKSIGKSQDLKIFCVFKILMDLKISEAFCDMYNYKMTE